MQRALVTGLAASSLLALAASWAPATAQIDPLVVDLDPPDTEVQFFGGSSMNGWTDSDDNPGSNLDNSNPETEGNYLSALLGFVSTDPDRPQFIERFEDDQGEIPGGPDANSVTDFDPNFAWTYAVVQTGTTHTFFQNSTDGLLTTGEFQLGISHITFFTPLPAAAWMLLSGLAGFFGLRWWGGRKAAAA